MIDAFAMRSAGIRRVGGVLAFIAATAVLIPARATAFSCSHAGNYHDGYYTTPTTSKLRFTGTQAIIDIQSARQCSGGTHQFTNVYVMLASNPDYTNEGWAQAGYEYQPGKGIRDFAQTVNGASTYTYYGKSTLGVATTREYASVINKACGFCIIISAQGKAMQIEYQGTDGWAAPYSLQYSGEARYAADDIAGIVTNKTRLSHLTYQGSDYTLHAVPCGIFAAQASSSRWKHQSVGCAEKNLWTDPTN